MSIIMSTASSNWSSTSCAAYLCLCIHSPYSMSTSTTSILSSFLRISIALLYAECYSSMLFDDLANLTQTFAIRLALDSFMLLIAERTFLPSFERKFILASQRTFWWDYGMYWNASSVIFSPSFQSFCSAIHWKRAL